jgi:hypothetical protein
LITWIRTARHAQLTRVAVRLLLLRKEARPALYGREEAADAIESGRLAEMTIDAGLNPPADFWFDANAPLVVALHACEQGKNATLLRVSSLGATLHSFRSERLPPVHHRTPNTASSSLT